MLSLKLKIDKKQLQAQSMLWPGVIILFVFMYLPMYGVVIAFKDYNIISGFWQAPWIGFKYFKEFLSYDRFYRVLRNSLAINVLQLIFAFPAPIIFALLLNEIRHMAFRRLAQTVSYLPHFVSWVIFGGLIYVLLSPRGIVNDMLVGLGILKGPVLFMGRPGYFWFIAVSSGIAKNFGWGSIIYLAAIAGVDQELYDAAVVDGARRFQRMWHITLPAIQGTITIMLIFAVSRIMNTGFDHIWMLHNPLNLEMSETIEVYVYKVGLENFRFSYATAVGFMKSVVSLVLLWVANFISRRISEHGLY